MKKVNVLGLIQHIKDEYPEPEENANQEITKEYFLELCQQYHVKATQELVDYVEDECEVTIDYTAVESKVSTIEDKISSLLEKYDASQKRHHGDSAESKKIEAQIEDLECQLDALKDEKSQAYKAAWKYLRKLAANNGWKEYEITEDSYEFPEGLLLIGYEDEDHEQEIDHVCVDVMDFLRKNKTK